jgi:hypothetical protein
MYQKIRLVMVSLFMVIMSALVWLLLQGDELERRRVLRHRVELGRSHPFLTCSSSMSAISKWSTVYPQLASVGRVKLKNPARRQICRMMPK